MGRRGPQPTPTEVLKQRGSRRAKDAKRKDEVKVPKAEKIPSPPAWLKGDAARQYQRVGKILHLHGLLTDLDAEMLAMFAERLSQYFDLRDACVGERYAEQTEKGMVHRNPVFAMRDDAWRDVIRVMKEFGLSPASRVGLAIKKNEPLPDNVIDIRKANRGFAT